jgi:hypothetical protein
MVEILQKFVAFSEYMNCIKSACSLNKLCTFCHQMLLFVPIPKLLAVNKATLSMCKCAAAATYFGTLLAEK